MSPVHQVWPKPSYKTQWKGKEDKAGRKRWEDNTGEWTGLEFAKSQRAVENREKWRKLVVKSSVGQWDQPVGPQRPLPLRNRRTGKAYNVGNSLRSSNSNGEKKVPLVQKHVWDRVKVWILKGEQPQQQKSISTFFFSLWKKFENWNLAIAWKVPLKHKYALKNKNEQAGISAHFPPFKVILRLSWGFPLAQPLPLGHHDDVVGKVASSWPLRMQYHPLLHRIPIWRVVSCGAKFSNWTFLVSFCLSLRRGPDFPEQSVRFALNLSSTWSKFLETNISALVIFSACSKFLKTNISG